MNTISLDWAKDILHGFVSRGGSVHLSATTIGLTLIAIYISYILIRGIFFCPLGHVPGPVTTRFGAAYWQYHLIAGSAGTHLAALHKKYGPVVRLTPTSLDAQLIEVSQDGWKGHNTNKMPWEKDPWFQRLARMGMKVDNLVGIPGFPEAMRMRRLMGAPFGRKFLLDQEYIFKSCVKNAVDGIDRIASSNDGVVDIHRQNKLYAFDVITEFAYGGFFKGGSVGNKSATDLMEQIVLPNVIDSVLPIVYKTLYAIPWKMFDWIRTRDLLLQSIIDYKRNVIPGSRKDTLSSLIQAKDEDGRGLSDEELVGASFVVMFGGVDTTAVTLTYLMYLLATHPQYIDKIAAELSGYSDVDSMKSVELEKLPYLNAVIREGLRLYPPFPAPFGWFGLIPADEAQMWDQNMIFSDGPRICLGKDIALLEIRLLLSAIILKYEGWTGIPDSPEQWDKEMRPFETFVISPPKQKCVVKLKWWGTVSPTIFKDV